MSSISAKALVPPSKSMISESFILRSIGLLAILGSPKTKVKPCLIINILGLPDFYA